MISTKDICFDLQHEILHGEKMPHGASHPVIYRENDKYYLAAFVCFFTVESIRTYQIDRPSVWILADINTGKIIEERRTADKEFSDASYDKKYNIKVDYDENNGKDYYEKAEAILDKVRKEIIEKGTVNQIEYQNYLDMIIFKTPNECQRFYADLSI